MVQLNKKEFNDKIFTRINNLIHDYNLINEHELIAVALSGGKDSVLTLHALKNYQNYLDYLVGLQLKLLMFVQQHLEFQVLALYLWDFLLLFKVFYKLLDMLVNLL